jgi:type I restriction enzyme R subunit
MEAIENNVRRLIIDESPINPKYYEKMSELLDALIQQRKSEALSYKKYLEKIVELTRRAKNPTAGASYPKAVNTAARQALYDNFGRSEAFALQVDEAVRAFRQDDWRANIFKVRKLRGAIKTAVEMYMKQSGASPVPMNESYRGRSIAPEDELVEEILELVKNQHEY